MDDVEVELRSQSADPSIEVRGRHVFGVHSTDSYADRSSRRRLIALTLGDVAVGAKILIDANIFVYAFTPDPIFGPPCIHFFDRVRRSEFDGAVTAHALSESAHRIMSIEACATFGWSFKRCSGRAREDV